MSWPHVPGDSEPMDASDRHPPSRRPGAGTHALGRTFEDAAASWLARRGWSVLERNVRFRRREVDLIARRGEVIAFVEVKGRRSGRYGRPEEAVTALKRREIESVARWWIERNGRPGLAYRFDVVAVGPPGPDGRLPIEHLEDAWRP